MAFTTIANGDDLQALALVNELYNAYSERNQAIDGAAINQLSAGTDIQNHTFWQTMQDWITTNCVSFVDDFAGLTSVMTTFPMLTANLVKNSDHANLIGGSSGVIGFRRVSGANWPTDWTNYADAAYSYGPCQAGDIIGPWLWVDLQAAFKALKWTVRTLAGGGKQSTRTASGIDADCATALANQNTAWTASSWSAYAAAGIKYTYVVQGISNGTGAQVIFQGDRSRGYIENTTIPLFVASACEVYYKAQMATSSSPITDYFGDLDSIGCAVDDYFLVDSIASSSDATRTTAVFGDISTNPVTLAGLDCTNLTNGYGMTSTRNRTPLALSYWVCKWDFTYQ